MANFDEFYKSFPTDEDQKWQFFEKEVVPWFLKEDPLFSSWISNVWTFNDYPRRWRKKKKDLGTDLVFEDIYGNDWAVQAKCYDQKYYVSKKDIDSFISDSNRKQIKGRILIITTNLIGANAIDTLQGQEKESKVFRLEDFRKANINYPIKSIDIQKKYFKKPHTPRKFQLKAIENAGKYLKGKDRGKLIMACGTGKTLTALWIQEAANYQRILYLVPSLYLVKQSLTEWINNCSQPFEWQCVCSDPTVNEGLSKDYFAEKKTDVCVPITTQIDDVKSFLSRDKKQVIFCTYHSLPLIEKVFKDDRIKGFDITFADESHRCVGHDKKVFGLILDEGPIKTSKRVFMTATPISLKDKDKEKAIKNGIDFYSMDDEKVFGDEIYKITFRQAINQRPPLLTNYQVYAIAIEDDPSIKEKVIKRKILSTDGTNEINAEELTNHIALIKGIKRFDLKKIITFHNRNKWAEEFAKDHLEIIRWLDNEYLPSGKIEFLNVNGGMQIHEREGILSKLEGPHIDHRTLISNSRCLTEGIDIPSLDCIAFIDPRSSEQDIIQAIGRVIRIDKNNPEKIGTILIPIDLGNCDDFDEKILSSKFSIVWQVVNALKYYDEYLNNEIENLRIELGKKPKPGRKRKGLEIIQYSLPERISLNFFNAIQTLLIRETSDPWLEIFGELEELVHKIGFRAFRRKSKFGKWVGTQRTNYKKNRQYLSKRRIELLESLTYQNKKIWVWDVLEALWFENYYELIDFVKQNGHARPDFNKNKKLAKWVSRQKTLSLDEVKRNLLNEIEYKGEKVFCWGDPEKEDWLFMFDQLKKFISKNHHAELNQHQTKEREVWVRDLKEKKWISLISKPNFEKGGDKTLHKWVLRQRGEKKKIGKYKSKVHNEWLLERSNKLENLHNKKGQLVWFWDIKERNWDVKFEELEIFIELNHHANPTETNNPKLCNWCKTQRDNYELQMSNNPKFDSEKDEYISKKRIEKLNALSYKGKNVWEWSISNETKYLKQLKRVEKAINKNKGKLPSIGNTSEGQWINKQRIAHKQNNLSDERIKLCNDLNKNILNPPS